MIGKCQGVDAETPRPVLDNGRVIRREGAGQFARGLEALEIPAVFGLARNEREMLHQGRQRQVQLNQQSADVPAGGGWQRLRFARPAGVEHQLHRLVADFRACPKGRLGPEAPHAVEAEAQLDSLFRGIRRKRSGGQRQ